MQSSKPLVHNSKSSLIYIYVYHSLNNSQIFVIFQKKNLVEETETIYNIIKHIFFVTSQRILEEKLQQTTTFYTLDTDLLEKILV